MDLFDRAGRLKRGYCALLEPEAYPRHVKLEHHSGLQQVLYNRLVGLLTQDGAQGCSTRLWAQYLATMDLFDCAGRPKVGYWAPCEATSLSRACRVGEPLWIAAGFVQSVGGLADSRWIPRVQHTSRGTTVSNNGPI